MRKTDDCPHDALWIVRTSQRRWMPGARRFFVRCWTCKSRWGPWDRIEDADAWLKMARTHRRCPRCGSLSSLGTHGKGRCMDTRNGKRTLL